MREGVSYGVDESSRETVARGRKAEGDVRPALRYQNELEVLRELELAAREWYHAYVNSWEGSPESVAGNRALAQAVQVCLNAPFGHRPRMPGDRAS